MTLRPKSTFNGSASRQDVGSHPPPFAPTAGRGAYRATPRNAYLPSSESGDSFRDRVFAVADRKWLVLLCTALGLAIAAGICIGSPPRYEAKATITMMNEPENLPDGSGQPEAHRPKNFNVYVGSRANTLAEIMNSFAVRKVVAIRMTKTKEKGSAQAKKDAPAEAPPSSESMFPTSVPKVKLRQAKQQSAQVQVSTKASRPDLASRSLEAYLGLLKEYSRQQRLSDAVKALTWLKEGLAKARDDVNTSRKTLDDFKKSHGMLFGDSTRSLRQRLTSGPFARWWLAAEDQSEKDGSSQEDELILPKRDKTPDLYAAALTRHLSFLQSRYDDMMQVYSPTYPKAVLLKKKIANLRDTIARLREQAKESSASRKKAFEEIAKKEREESWRELVRLNQAGPEFRLLEMDLETNERLYSLLFTAFRQAEQRVNSVPDEFVVSSSPVVAEISPEYWKKMGIGGVVGLIGGLALALTLASLDTRIRSGADIENHLSCKFLGAVPDIPSYGQDESYSSMGKPKIIELLDNDDLGSPLLDPCRNIHTSIFFSAMGTGIRSIAVSSTFPGEGKTMVTVSLAGVMCLDKTKSVLIIDADLRKPRIHRMFGHSHPGNGLSTLVRKGSVDWSGMVHSSRIPGLYYMMSGPIPRDPVATLRSEVLEEVFASLKESFDLIIVDTPPLLGFPDAVIASALADGTVMVVQEGRVQREIMSEAIRFLLDARGTRLLGAVLNRVRPPRRTLYGYFSGYSYRYGGRA